MTVLNSGFRAEDSGFPGTQFESLSVEIRLWILIFRRFPDSNRKWDSGFLERHSGLKSQGFRIPQTNFPRFWIPQAKISCIPESTWGEKSLLWAEKRISLIDNSLSQRWGHRTRISILLHRRYKRPLDPRTRTKTITRFDLNLFRVFSKYRFPGKLKFTMFH